MTAWTALRDGSRELGRAWPVLLIFYAAATVPAVLATAVLLSVAYLSVGHSAWAGDLVVNLDPQWIAELVAKGGWLFLAPWPAAVAGALASFALGYLFLLGGAVEILGAGRRFSTFEYFGACGRRFWPLVHLSVAAGFCCAGPLLLNSVLSSVGSALWGGGSQASPLVYWGWFRAAAVLSGFGLVNLIFEYAAILMALEDRRAALPSMVAAVRLIAEHPWRTFRLYAALWAIYAAALAAGLGLSRAPQTTLAGVAALFLARQALVMVKTSAWLLFFAAQSRHLRAELKPIG